MTNVMPLSGLLCDVAEVAGRDSAIALAEAFGGRSIYIPAKARANHPISRAIGLDAARALSARFGAGRINVPLGAKARDGFAPEIARLLTTGMAVPDIAREVGCTERTVYRVKASINHSTGP